MIVCNKCRLLTAEKGRCPCGFTEEHIVKSKDLIPFFEKYNETPTTITFIDIMYDDDLFFRFSLTRDYAEPKTFRTTILYYSKERESITTLINSVQEYQMIKLSPLKRKLDKIIKEKSKEQIETAKLRKRASVSNLFKEYIDKEAKRYKISTAKFISILLDIYKSETFFSKEYI